MQAMILAAGFGTRLLPHTTLRPKPLFPILNQPLLLLTIKRLQNAGFDRIIVNCHHLKEQIVEQLSGLLGVIIQQEDTILGTGGGLRRALTEMRDEPLLVTNGDIYHTVDYGRLYAEHLANACPATLAMHDYPRFNTVQVSDNRIIAFRNDNSTGKNLAFTGLYVLNPEILRVLDDGVASCIVDHYRNLLQDGKSLGVYRVDGSYWTDMGTPEDYLALHGGLLTGTIPRWDELGYDNGNTLLVSREARLAGRVRLSDWCSIGKATGQNISLSRVVVWDGVDLCDGYCNENALISVTPERGGKNAEGRCEATL